MYYNLFIRLNMYDFDYLVVKNTEMHFEIDFLLFKTITATGARHELFCTITHTYTQFREGRRNVQIKHGLKLQSVKMHITKVFDPLLELASAEIVVGWGRIVLHVKNIIVHKYIICTFYLG